MSLIIALGSNQGDCEENLSLARQFLKKHFIFEASSRIYKSKAVDYTEQPDFFNQVIQYQLPEISPCQALQTILEIEKKMGRVRDIPKGPRVIDIDIIFWGDHEVDFHDLTIPHPRWDDRSFVVLPLKELPYYSTIEKNFSVNDQFSVEAVPLSCYKQDKA